MRVVDLGTLKEVVSPRPMAGSSQPAPNTVIRVEVPAVEIKPVLDLGERLESIDCFQFEKLVALMYRRLGFQVERRGGRKSGRWDRPSY